MIPCTQEKKNHIMYCKIRQEKKCDINVCLTGKGKNEIWTDMLHRIVVTAMLEHNHYGCLSEVSY